MVDDAFLREHDAPIPPHIKGLIFDCDGTLVDTMPLHFLAWARVTQTHGLEFSERRFYEFAGMPTLKIVEVLAAEQGVTVNPGEIAHEKERIYLESIPGVQRVKRVVDIALRERGQRRMAVASGGWRHVVLQSLQIIHMESAFDAVVGADEVEHGKPAPDLFLKAAELLGVQPAECVVYEDAELGFQAARAAGMACVDVRPWYSS